MTKPISDKAPESNGIAEAFVKTLKRDYARLSILPDGEISSLSAGELHCSPRTKPSRAITVSGR
jgi:hypothetical protein